MATSPNKGAVAVLAFTSVFVLVGILSLFWPERAERALDYSVKVQISEEKGLFWGSGTVIAHTHTRSGHSIVTHSIVLTNAHVVGSGDRSPVTVVWNGSKIPGRIVPGSVDEERDLALIEVDVALPVALLFFEGEKNGEPVIAVGNQFNSGLIISDGRAGPRIPETVKSGQVENFELSASSFRGSSGGGVFAWRYGRLGLVGVVQSIPLYPMVGSFLGMPVPVYVSVTTISYARPMEIVDEYLAEHGF